MEADVGLQLNLNGSHLDHRLLIQYDCKVSQFHLQFMQEMSRSTFVQCIQYLEDKILLKDDG